MIVVLVEQLPIKRPWSSRHVTFGGVLHDVMKDLAIPLQRWSRCTLDVGLERGEHRRCVVPVRGTRDTWLGI